MKSPVVSNEWNCWRDPEHRIVNHHPTFDWPRCATCRAAPAYHERPGYLPANLELTIYVPSSTSVASRFTSFCAPGSGIVGCGETDGERTTVYYEGWVNGAMQYSDLDARGRWEAGVYHAASRMVTEYPTIALASPRLGDLRAIGSYNPTTHAFTIDDEAALTAWIDSVKLGHVTREEMT